MCKFNFAWEKRNDDDIKEKYTNFIKNESRTLASKNKINISVDSTLNGATCSNILSDKLSIMIKVSNFGFSSMKFTNFVLDPQTDSTKETLGLNP